MLSLFGLVLAIGIVVDDAIVVVENVQRWLDEGLEPARSRIPGHGRSDAGRYRHRVRPLGGLHSRRLHQGITGQFYRQFALTIAFSTLLSAFNSLTLSPALSALLLRPHSAGRIGSRGRWISALGWFFRLVQPGISMLTTAGTRIAAVCGPLMRSSHCVVFRGLVFLAYGMFKVVPTGFIPPQDQGYLIVNVQMPDAVLHRPHRGGHVTIGRPGE